MRPRRVFVDTGAWYSSDRLAAIVAATIRTKDLQKCSAPARCAREFEAHNLHLLTVHDRDGNQDSNPVVFVRGLRRKRGAPVRRRGARGTVQSPA